MVNKAKKLLMILLIFSLTFTACYPKEKTNNNPPDELKTKAQNEIIKNINQYNIDITFNPQEKTIKGNQRVIYINNEDTKIDKIYFHLYPNAFREKRTAPFLFDDFMNAYPKGFEEGYIDIEEVKIEGVKSSFIISEADKTIMEVRLPYELDIGNKISIDMKYTIKIPPATERFGYGNDTYNFGNWYPIIAVYDNSGWNLDPYYPIGDPFYSDISNYKVTIRTPKDYIIATSGNVISTEVIDNTLEWKIEANTFRDFAWVASNKFEIVEEKVDDTLVKMYFLNEGTLDEDIKNKTLKFAEDSLKIFNKVFGKYPYTEYSVVQTNFPSGMEYPGIVFIGSKYYDRSFINFLEIIIVHETAHQWWYGVVGNDQIDQAWLDESFASYSEVVYFDENYGQRIGERYHKTENEEVFNQRKDALDNDVILKGLKDFNDWHDYSLLVYTKGALLLDDIKDKYGEEVFYNILKTYYNKYKFKLATTEDFINVCEEITGDELDDYFEKWLK